MSEEKVLFEDHGNVAVIVVVLMCTVHLLLHPMVIVGVVGGTGSRSRKLSGHHFVVHVHGLLHVEVTGLVEHGGHQEVFVKW